MFRNFQDTFTFDDVLLSPKKSDILPKDVILGSFLTPKIKLNLPFISAPMDTVTESEMAVRLASMGGIGIIHKNLSIEQQVREVRIVKRFENGFIDDPMTVHPDDHVKKVIEIRHEYGYKKVPVVDRSGKLVGFISDVDYLIPQDEGLRVHSRMQHIKEMHLGREGMSLQEAYQMIRDYRLRTLCIVDREGNLTSLVTRRDLEKSTQFPDAIKDKDKQLLVGAAVSVGQAAMDRAEALIKAETDVIVVDTAHGHSGGVINMIRELKNTFDVQVIAGNIGTGEAAIDLIEAGADAVKVGIGPGSICTTRVVAGIGVPQLSAIMDVVNGIKKAKRRVPIIADGGIKTSGDVVKALAAGAQSVMMGNMFSGTEETPGRVEYIEGRMFKVYRGMGSLDAMEQGSKDRYGQAHLKEKKKFVPEGVSGRVAYKGPVQAIVYQLAGGVRSGMGYCGSRTIPELQKKAKFVKITGSALKESHPHDLKEIKSAPNYSVEE
jgi:IMP dehydrogenase